MSLHLFDCNEGLVISKNATVELVSDVLDVPEYVIESMVENDSFFAYFHGATLNLLLRPRPAPVFDSYLAYIGGEPEVMKFSSIDTVARVVDYPKWVLLDALKRDGYFIRPDLRFVLGVPLDAAAGVC